MLQYYTSTDCRVRVYIYVLSERFCTGGRWNMSAGYRPQQNSFLSVSLELYFSVSGDSDSFFVIRHRWGQYAAYILSGYSMRGGGGVREYARV